MRHTLSLLFIAFFIGVYGQSTTKDPVSYFGIGEQANGNNSIYNALGKNNFNFFDSTQLNIYNPASYNTMSNGNTLFSLDINNRLSRYQQGSTTEYNSALMLEHYAMGFKMKKRMGMAFGLRPFSSRGYSFSEQIYTGTDYLKYTYSGNGGIHNLFLGFSYGIIHKKNTKLALGTNLSYLFGNVSNERKSLLVDASTTQGGLSRDLYRMTAFHYEIGTYFRQQLTPKQQILLSGVVEPTQKYNTTYRQEFYTASNIESPSTYDTLTYTETSGKINIDLSYKLGLNYQICLPNWQRKSRSLHPGFNIMASYTKAGAISHNFSSVGAWPLVSNSKISLGVQFNPELKIFENISNLKTLEKWSYRVGAFQQTLPYVINDKQFVDRGVTFGLGIPLLAQQSLSSLNFAFTLGERGNNDPAKMKESYIGINFGLILSPSAFDKWFRKRKLD